MDPSAKTRFDDLHGKLTTTLRGRPQAPCAGSADIGNAPPLPENLLKRPNAGPNPRYARTTPDKPTIQACFTAVRVSLPLSGPSKSPSRATAPQTCPEPIVCILR